MRSGEQHIALQRVRENLGGGGGGGGGVVYEVS